MALWKIADYKIARGLDASAYLVSSCTDYGQIQLTANVEQRPYRLQYHRRWVELLVSLASY